MSLFFINLNNFLWWYSVALFIALCFQPQNTKQLIGLDCNPVYQNNYNQANLMLLADGRYPRISALLAIIIIIIIIIKVLQHSTQLNFNGIELYVESVARDPYPLDRGRIRNLDDSNPVRPGPPLIYPSVWFVVGLAWGISEVDLDDLTVRLDVLRLSYPGWARRSMVARTTWAVIRARHSMSGASRIIAGAGYAVD